jgi:adenylyl-sulfate kinase
MRGLPLMPADPAPLWACREFVARIVWTSAEPALVDVPYFLEHASRRFCSCLRKVRHVTGVQSPEPVPGPVELRRNGIAEVEIETHLPLRSDPSLETSGGAFTIVDLVTNQTLASGTILGPAPAAPQVSPASPNGGLTVWFTGLSASGKTTICTAVHQLLAARGCRVEVLDGDVVRKYLSKGLGFSREDRDENIRRIGFVARLLTRRGVIALAAAISPYRAIRDEVRASVGDFLEVYVNAPLEVCEARDPKGLYRKARAGELPAFTGIDDPYEPPLRPEAECLTGRESVEESVAAVMAAVDRALAARRGSPAASPPPDEHRA